MRLITRQGRISEEHQPKCVLSSIYLQASCGLISHQLAGPLEMVKVTSIEMWKHIQLPKKKKKEINNQRLHTKAQCFPASLPAIPAHQESSCPGEQRDRSKQAGLTMRFCQEYQNLHHTTRLESHTDNNTLDHRFATSFNLLNILRSSDQHELPNWNGRRGKKKGQRVNVSVAFGTECLQITVWSSRADL